MKKGYKECPFCKNEIKKEAIKCQYCKEMLPEEPKEKTKKGMIECPFCKNEIKEGAVKCQFCHEILEQDKNAEKKKEKIKKDVIKDDKEDTEEIIITGYKPTTRTKRFFAAFFDLILNVTIIGFFYNIIIAFWKGETVGFNILGIKFIQNNGNKLTGRQRFYRFALYRPIAYYFLMAIVIIFNYTVNINVEWIVYIGIGIILLNTAEWFFKSPTFLEKLRGIRKVQYKKPNGWAMFLLIILLVVAAKANQIVQEQQQRQQLQEYLNSPEFTEKMNMLNNRTSN